MTNRVIKFRALSFGTSVETGKHEWMYLEYAGDEWDGLYKEETVGQFTGLTDKNGKEIYEGDVVEWKGVRGEVWYNESAARFFFDDSKGLHLEPHYGHEAEVIGNIYENPELISN
jgi:hypothetical protein